MDSKIDDFSNYNISRGSVHKMRYKLIKQKVLSIREKIQELMQEHPASMKAELGRIDQFVSTLEDKRVLSNTIIHLRIPNFFAQIESVVNPRLENEVFCVAKDNLLCGISEKAKEKGILDDFTLSQAKKMLPDIQVVLSNFPEYRKYHKKLLGLLKNYDSNLQSNGIGEFTLNVTGLLTETNSRHLGQRIKNEIIDKYRIESCIGIGSNALIAQIAANESFKIIPNRKKDIRKFMKKQTIYTLPNLGDALISILTAFDISNCEDILKQRLALFYLLSKGVFESLIEMALGISHFQCANLQFSSGDNIEQQSKLGSFFPQKKEIVRPEINNRLTERGLKRKLIEKDEKNKKYKYSLKQSIKK